ncbi:hypothetical protein [Phenylobacterium sp.]|uniref:hypothetical protein n=1 Tax=Phenylobacterium sp. TaxID=1871053 RepID=UPI002FC755E5
MVLQVEIPRTHYVSDGVEDTFSTVFTFELPEEVTVWRGVPTMENCCEEPSYDALLHLNVDWIMLPGNYLTDGGEVQLLPHAIQPNGETITLMRTTPPSQPEGFGDHQRFEPEQHEFTLDRITRMVQELYHNPFGVIVLGALAYEHRFYAPDAWTDTTPMDVHNFARPVQYPANFEGSVGSVETYPSSAVTLSLRDQDDVEVGTMVLPTSGTITFTTTNPAGFAKSYGSQFKVVPPETGMAGAIGVAATFVGQVVAA